MTSRHLFIAGSAVAVVLAPLAVFAQWQGAPGTAPNSNVAGPVWLQTSAPVQQTGNSYISGSHKTGSVPQNLSSGDIGLSNDLYITSNNKSIRVDGNGTRNLYIGNYDPDNDDTLNVYVGGIMLTDYDTGTADTLTVPRICLNGDCRTSWPTGSVSDIWVDTVGDSMTGALLINSAAQGDALYARNTNATWSTGVTGMGNDWGVYGTVNTTGYAGWDTAGVFDAGNPGAGGEVGVWARGDYTGVDANGGQYGVVARARNVGGWDASVYADATTNAGVEFGVYATGGTSAGIRADGTATGVVGYGGTSTGVYGEGAVYGVNGYTATGGTGVNGTSGAVQGNGVHGYAPASSGRGVVGYAPGSGGLGVYGVGTGLNGRGVYGDAGSASGGIGVYGNASASGGVGVYGYAGAGTGVWGQSVQAASPGVVGNNPAGGVGVSGFGDPAVRGQSGNVGVYGISTGSGPGTGGVIGHSQGASGRGVVGLGGSSGVGVHAEIELNGNGTAITTNRGGTGLLVQEAETYGIRVQNKGTHNANRWLAFLDGNNGFTSNGLYVDVSGGVAAQFLDGVRFAPGTDTAPGLAFYDDPNTGMFRAGGDILSFATAGAERLRIGSTGNLQIFGSFAYRPGGGSWDATSDIRLKDVQGEYVYGLNELMDLNPIWFNYKEGNPNGYDSSVTYAGISAQSVQEVIPEAVSEDENGYYTVNFDPIHWATVNAVKELKAENDDLKSEISDLKSRLEKVEEYLGL